MNGIDPIKAAFDLKQQARLVSQERLMNTRMEHFAKEGDHNKAKLQDQNFCFMETFKGDTLKGRN